jgi:hypothetical protein
MQLRNSYAPLRNYFVHLLRNRCTIAVEEMYNFVIAMELVTIDALSLRYQRTITGAGLWCDRYAIASHCAIAALSLRYRWCAIMRYRCVITALPPQVIAVAITALIDAQALQPV